MKIIAFSDPHSDLKAIESVKRLAEKEKPDCIVCTGDITLAGRELKETLKAINSLPAQVFLIHGNHEDLSEVESIIDNYKNITFVHQKIINFKGYTIIGYGGGGFSNRYYDFEMFVKTNADKLHKDKVIFIHHHPAYNTILDISNWTENHAGSSSFTDFIIEFKPVAAFCGHFHESFGMEEIYEETLIANPGPKGKVFKI